MSRSASAAVLKCAPRIRQVRLAGTSPGLDPRTHAFRPDLADLALAELVAAAHYAEPMMLACRAGHTPMRSRPSDTATAVSELLYGEQFATLEISSGWAWGSSVHDGYVGYVAAAAFWQPAGTSTHRVSAASALLFSAPDIKSPMMTALPLNACVAVTGREGRFHAVEGGYIHERHLAPLTVVEPDSLAIAREFLGTPYLWGGRTRDGIDCSGLVQTALMACGLACPRDTDQQRMALGEAADPASPQRGDLVFFPGHVGIMASATELLHANAWWMNTVIEPLGDVIERLRPDHAEPVLAVRRLTSV